ncbi:hypothetical protein RJ639_041845 [Escallonia herrerae]|uniref:Uncharacterized protein n=1 Tax=Escallonia herrerae TaxID=1293975 RepID=A0AA89B5C4_9ASTE|nr:hypothetical protein RJ639_041845 [Escallonia herrerae]
MVESHVIPDNNLPACDLRCTTHKFKLKQIVSGYLSNIRIPVNATSSKQGSPNTTMGFHRHALGKSEGFIQASSPTKDIYHASIRIIMFATAIRYVGKKPKPKMKPIELKTPPEQTQTITRAIFEIVKEHGPLTVADTWEHVNVSSGYISQASRSWLERTDKQKAHENRVKMDEGEAKA